MTRKSDWPRKVLLGSCWLRSRHSKGCPAIIAPRTEYFMSSSGMPYPSVARVYADVNSKMPNSYWDYDNLQVQWGYALICGHYERDQEGKGANFSTQVAGKL